MGIEHKVVKKLLEVFDDPKFPLDINLNQKILEVMKLERRYFLRIGKSALMKEKEILNNISGDGINNNKAGDVNEDKSGGSGLKKISTEVLHYSIDCVLGSAIGDKNFASRKSARRDSATQKVITYNAKALFDKNNIISLGAGSIKGRYIPGKFVCYKITYPNFKIGGKDAAINFLKQLRDCKTVVNSLLCFTGKKNIYEKAINSLTNSKT